MRVRTFLLAFTTSALLFGSALGCAGNQEDIKHAAVKPGNMPLGADWEGVYFNPVWGNLHIVMSAGDIKGKWKRTDESAWGELEGKVTGDVVRFAWVEHKSGLVGPSATTKGHGYFRYTSPGGDMDDRLVGEWGFDNSEVGGGEWDAIKQRNVKPDLKSVTGDADPGMGGWR